MMSNFKSILPDSLKNLFLGTDPSGMMNKIAEQMKFPAGKKDFFAVP